MKLTTVIITINVGYVLNFFLGESSVQLRYPPLHFGECFSCPDRILWSHLETWYLLYRYRHNGSIVAA